jgi:hypothetical protein
MVTASVKGLPEDIAGAPDERDMLRPLADLESLPSVPYGLPGLSRDDGVVVGLSGQRRAEALVIADLPGQRRPALVVRPKPIESAPARLAGAAADWRRRGPARDRPQPRGGPDGSTP